MIATLSPDTRRPQLTRTGVQQRVCVNPFALLLAGVLGEDPWEPPLGALLLEVSSCLLSTDYSAFVTAVFVINCTLRCILGYADDVRT